MTNLNAWLRTVTAGLIFSSVMVPTAFAQDFNTLFTFDETDGAQPMYMALVQGIDGELYGTTSIGGTATQCYYGGCGTVFRITPAGVLTVLYSFCVGDDCLGGTAPQAGLVLATDGNFYGTTATSSVFRITSKGSLTTIFNICYAGVCKNGQNPWAPVIQGSNGNLYGTASSGGHCSQPGGCGTLFEVSTQGTLVRVYRFCSEANCPDGRNPYAPLVQGTDGNFYGTTAFGGVNDAGTLFKVIPQGVLTTLHSFCSQPNCSDGEVPTASLIQASDGNLYGTTFYGGNSNCAFSNSCGTIFKITPDGILTTVYRFCEQVNCPDGSNPWAGLIQGTDGNFYGTTPYGGADLVDCSNNFPGCGTVFQITPEGVLTTLHSFSNIDGAAPQGGLLQATNGIFYGTTTLGGKLNCLYPSGSCGTVFSINMGLDPFVSFVRNPARVGQQFGILGQGLTGSSSVSLNGTPASFIIKSDTLILATVPSGATTGYVTVTTPTGVLTSNVPFNVIP